MIAGSQVKNSPKSSFHFWHRFIAVFVAIAFFLFDVTHYVPQVYAIPQEQIVDTIQAPISIPPELGKIEEYHRGKSNKTIIYIQDAHDSLEAQEHIAELIQNLIKDHNVKTVFEEGYEGTVPTDKLFGFIKNPKVKEKVSYFLLDKLRIGGAEYAHINRTQDFKLIGVDNVNLYRENIAWYQKASKKRKDTEEDLSELKKEIKALAHRYFPKDLKSWLKLKEKFTDHKLPLLDYLRETQTLYLKFKPLHHFTIRYPFISLVLGAKNTKDKTLLHELESLDSKALFQEIDQLERDFSGKLLTTERGQKIFTYYQGISLLERLNQIELTQSEYEAAKGTLKSFKTEKLLNLIVEYTQKPLVLSKEWEQNINNATQFYEAAHARDESIQMHLKDFLQNSDEKIAILVFGGFHGTKIKEILKRQNFSYGVISPKITSIDKEHQDYYKQLMAVGHHHFETLFQAGQAAKPPGVVNMPELAAKSELEAIESIIEYAGNLDISVPHRRIERQLSSFRAEVRVAKGGKAQSVGVVILGFNNVLVDSSGLPRDFDGVPYVAEAFRQAMTEGRARGLEIVIATNDSFSEIKQHFLDKIKNKQDKPRIVYANGMGQKFVLKKDGRYYRDRAYEQDKKFPPEDVKKIEALAKMEVNKYNRRIETNFEEYRGRYPHFRFMTRDEKSQEMRMNLAKVERRGEENEVTQISILPVPSRYLQGSRLPSKKVQEDQSTWDEHDIISENIKKKLPQAYKIVSSHWAALDITTRYAHANEVIGDLKNELHIDSKDIAYIGRFDRSELNSPSLIRQTMGDVILVDVSTNMVNPDMPQAQKAESGGYALGAVAYWLRQLTLMKAGGYPIRQLRQKVYDLQKRERQLGEEIPLLIAADEWLDWRDEQKEPPSEDEMVEKLIGIYEKHQLNLVSGAPWTRLYRLTVLDDLLRRSGGEERNGIQSVIKLIGDEKFLSHFIETTHIEGGHPNAFIYRQAEKLYRSAFKKSKELRLPENRLRFYKSLDPRFFLNYRDLVSQWGVVYPGASPDALTRLILRDIDQESKESGYSPPEVVIGQVDEAWATSRQMSQYRFAKPDETPPNIFYVAGGGKGTTLLSQRFRTWYNAKAKKKKLGENFLTLSMSAFDDSGYFLEVFLRLLFSGQYDASTLTLIGDFGSALSFLAGDDPSRSSVIWTLFGRDYEGKRLGKELLELEKGSIYSQIQSRLVELEGQIKTGKLDPPANHIRFSSNTRNLARLVDRELIIPGIISPASLKTSSPEFATWKHLSLLGFLLDLGVLRKGDMMVQPSFQLAKMDRKKLEEVFETRAGNLIPSSTAGLSQAILAAKLNDGKLLNGQIAVDTPHPQFISEITFRRPEWSDPRTTDSLDFPIKASHKLAPQDWPKASGIFLKHLRGTTQAVLSGDSSLFTSYLPQVMLKLEDGKGSVAEEFKNKVESGIPVIHIAKVKRDFAISRIATTHQGRKVIEGMDLLQQIKVFDQTLAIAGIPVKFDQMHSHIVIPSLATMERLRSIGSNRGWQSNTYDAKKFESDIQASKKMTGVIDINQSDYDYLRQHFIVYEIDEFYKEVSAGQDRISNSRINIYRPGKKQAERRFALPKGGITLESLRTGIIHYNPESLRDIVLEISSPRRAEVRSLNNLNENERNLIAYLSQEYRWQKVQGVRTMPGGGSIYSEPLLVVKTPKGKYIVKRLKKVNGKNGANFVADYVRHLQRGGIPIPTQERVTEESLLVEFSGKFYTVDRLLDGREISRKDASPKTLKVVGRMLGNIHNVSKKFKAISTQNYDHFSLSKTIDLELNPKARWRQMLNQYFSEDEKHLVEETIQHEVVATQHTLAQLDVQAIPSDLNFSNIMFNQQGDKIVGIFDWDQARMAYRLEDFFPVLFHTGRPGGFLHLGHFQEDLYALLEGYQETAAPGLTEFERNLIPNIFPTQLLMGLVLGLESIYELDEIDQQKKLEHLHKIVGLLSDLKNELARAEVRNLEYPVFKGNLNQFIEEILRFAEKEKGAKPFAIRANFPDSELNYIGFDENSQRLLTEFLSGVIDFVVDKKIQEGFNLKNVFSHGTVWVSSSSHGLRTTAAQTADEVPVVMLSATKGTRGENEEDLLIKITIIDKKNQREIEHVVYLFDVLRKVHVLNQRGDGYGDFSPSEQIIHVPLNTKVPVSFTVDVDTTPFVDMTATSQIKAQIRYEENAQEGFWADADMNMVSSDLGSYRFAIDLPHDFEGQFTFRYSLDFGQTWHWANHGPHENRRVVRAKGDPEKNPEIVLLNQNRGKSLNGEAVFSISKEKEENVFGDHEIVLISAPSRREESYEAVFDSSDMGSHRHRTIETWMVSEVVDGKKRLQFPYDILGTLSGSTTEAEGFIRLELLAGTSLDHSQQSEFVTEIVNYLLSLGIHPDKKLILSESLKTIFPGKNVEALTLGGLLDSKIISGSDKSRGKVGDIGIGKDMRDKDSNKKSLTELGILTFDEILRNQTIQSEIKKLYGNKALRLVEMIKLGLPVPKGLVISPIASDTQIEQALESIVRNIEAVTGKKLGDPDNPLALAVRSSPSQSMPGLLETELNANSKDDLLAAILKVRKSWDKPEAVQYRRNNKMPEGTGLAVIVQEMISTDIDENSGSGVLFTRDPLTGENRLTGQFAVKTLGEDLVQRTQKKREPIGDMASRWPNLHDQLLEIKEILEKHYQAVQEIEFAVHGGKLWLLQSRDAVLSPQALAGVSVDMANENVISSFRLLDSIIDSQRLQKERRLYRIQNEASLEFIGKGIPSSSGAVQGIAVFSVEEARRLRSLNKIPILFVSKRPEDIQPAIVNGEVGGIVTGYGHEALHESVLARSQGVSLIDEIENAVFGENDVMINGFELKQGDLVIMDGGTGKLYKGVEESVLVEDRTVNILGVSFDYASEAEKIRSEYQSRTFDSLKAEHDKLAAGLKQAKQITLDDFQNNLKAHVIHQLMNEKSGRRAEVRMEDVSALFDLKDPIVQKMFESERTWVSWDLEVAERVLKEKYKKNEILPVNFTRFLDGKTEKYYYSARKLFLKKMREGKYYPTFDNIHVLASIFYHLENAYTKELPDDPELRLTELFRGNDIKQLLEIGTKANLDFTRMMNDIVRKVGGTMSVIDLSPSAESARRSGIEVVIGDARELRKHFPDKRFDLIFNSGVLSYGGVGDMAPTTEEEFFGDGLDLLAELLNGLSDLPKATVIANGNRSHLILERERVESVANIIVWDNAIARHNYYDRSLDARYQSNSRMNELRISGANAIIVQNKRPRVLIKTGFKDRPVETNRSEVRVAFPREALSHFQSDQMIRSLRHNTQPATVFINASDFPNLSFAQKNEYLYVALAKSNLRLIVYNDNGQVKDQELEALLKLDHVIRTDKDLNQAFVTFSKHNVPNIHLSKSVLPDQNLIRSFKKKVTFFKEQGDKAGTLAVALLWALSDGEGSNFWGVNQGQDGFWTVVDTLIDSLQSSYENNLVFAWAA